MQRLFKLLAAALVAMQPVVAHPSVFTYTLTLQTEALQGTQAKIVFDLIDAAPLRSRATVGVVSTDAIFSSTSTLGDAIELAPWSALLGDADFLNEYALSGTLGKSTIFSLVLEFDQTPTTADPDAFSIYLLDPLTNLPLINTFDPTGAGALFLALSPTALAPHSIENYAPSAPPLFSLEIGAVPEPGSTSLLALGLLILTFCRIRTSHQA
jgi:hypothetical protein